MRKVKNLFDIPLDDEEQMLSDEIDKLVDAGELKSVKQAKDEANKLTQAAHNYLRKNAKINIRITSRDLEGIRRIATKEGLPYQTLIASILHKYVAKHLTA